MESFCPPSLTFLVRTVKIFVALQQATALEIKFLFLWTTRVTFLPGSPCRLVRPAPVQTPFFCDIFGLSDVGPNSRSKNSAAFSNKTHIVISPLSGIPTRRTIWLECSFSLANKNTCYNWNLYTWTHVHSGHLLPRTTRSAVDTAKLNNRKREREN
jgi:hypothetical protein